MELFLAHEKKRYEFMLNNFIEYKKLLKMKHLNIGDYSLKGFNKTKSIFVHIPKAAGVSIANSLYGNLGGGHLTIEQYKRIYSYRDFNAFFKYTFVRNPWDRLFSAFNFLKKGGMNNEDKHWADKHLYEIKNFEDFVLNWLTQENIIQCIHLKPQLSFLTDNDKVELNFIGRYENIDEDFAYVAQKLKIKNTIKKKNVTSKIQQDYKSFYTSKMIDKVSALYSKDIEKLNYTFE